MNATKALNTARAAVSMPEPGDEWEVSFPYGDDLEGPCERSSYRSYHAALAARNLAILQIALRLLGADETAIWQAQRNTHTMRDVTAKVRAYAKSKQAQA